MDFEKTIKDLFAEAVTCFNSGEYEQLVALTTESLELISPEIQSSEFYAPSIHLKSREAVFEYWKEIHSHHDNRITSYKFIKTGKNLLVRCFYDNLNMVIDCELKIDEYSKTSKIVNHLVSIKN